MAHLYLKVPQKELYCRCRVGIKEYYIGSSFTPTSSKIPCYNVSYTNQTRKNRGVVVHCCTSSSTSADQQVNLTPINPEPNGTYQNKKLQFDCLVSDVNWQVRRMVDTQDEMKKVANVQAEAFHEPVILFDDLFFDFFKAEVLSGLLYRLRNSPPDRYACLVAEPKTDQQESDQELAGVVDITVLREDSVLQHLPGAEEYLYVSGIAVLNKFRRQKVATALLKACDIVSAIWGFDYLALRAYEDDYGARKLYSNAGYRVVSGDPPWLTSWIGRRRRVLMVKRIDL
ncbi:hypothetical protein BUALT_Bualt08G0135600 [Buddleja alternifolia]|uniref:N-acetyltransferase domain-containing protein n=1 Tax=Buddleja alternifolia TaxID=168488 RepID=A0AAV6XD49_9LAMI|nr:hypothetical protein BUALT_Bualt08G0135600 [Buddleja alternifolia]